jgi:hypothetical protein
MIFWSKALAEEFFIFKKFLHDEKLEILISAEPFHLRPGIPVNNITFFILEVPRDNNQDVSFANPDLFLDLSFDPT